MGGRKALSFLAPADGNTRNEAAKGPDDGGSPFGAREWVGSLCHTGRKQQHQESRSSESGESRPWNRRHTSTSGADCVMPGSM
jgi:hypothetical protein